MNHIERARDLSQKIAKLKQRQDEKHRLDEYTAQGGKLNNETTVLAGLADIADELRKERWELASIKGPVDGVLFQTRRVATAFQADKSIILDPQLAPTFWHPLEGMRKKMPTDLKKEWKKYVESKIPSSQADILETLSKVQGFAPQAAKVRSLCADMRSLGEDLPRVGDFQRLDALAEQVAQAWDALQGEELPSVVLHFFKKAHTTGFSLMDLNSEVLDWLKEKNLLGQYTIRGK